MQLRYLLQRFPCSVLQGMVGSPSGKVNRMVPSDFKLWQAATDWWNEKAQEYLSLGDEQGFRRCLARAELNLLRRNEEMGSAIVWGPEIYV